MYLYIVFNIAEMVGDLCTFKLYMVWIHSDHKSTLIIFDKHVHMKQDNICFSGNLHKAGFAFVAREPFYCMTVPFNEHTMFTLQTWMLSVKLQKMYHYQYYRDRVRLNLIEVVLEISWLYCHNGHVMEK
jgi:hypothetical protein